MSLYVANPFDDLARAEEARRSPSPERGRSTPSPEPARRAFTPPPAYHAGETAVTHRPAPLPETKRSLAGIQVIVLVDVSKHMKEQDIVIAGTKFSRWEAVRQQLGKLCAELTAVDRDGIDIVLIGKEPSVTRRVTTAIKVQELIDKQKPHSYANITAAIKEAHKIHMEYKLRSSHKSTVVLVITAAEASSSHWFTNAKKELKIALVDIAQRVDHLNHRELGILFIQVGNDKSGKRMLEQFDDMQGLRTDVITEVNFSKLGSQLVIEDLIGKALAGC